MSVSHKECFWQYLLMYREVDVSFVFDFHTLVSVLIKESFAFGKSILALPVLKFRIKIM